MKKKLAKKFQKDGGAKNNILIKKIMNFEEWYKNWIRINFIGEPHRSIKTDCIIGWNACKKEVLKILENEMDKEDWSLATATQNIREKI